MQDQVPPILTDVSTDASGDAGVAELAPGVPAEAEAPGDFGPLLLAGFGFAVLSFTLVRMYRRRLQTRTTQFDTPPAERLAAIRDQAYKARDPIDTLMAEATELTTQLASQLDGKAAYLEVLLDRAEAVAERLERAQRASTTGYPQQTQAAQLATPRDAGGADPMQRQIYALADQGLDSLAIAQRLGQPKGQVELVLKLRRA